MTRRRRRAPATGQELLACFICGKRPDRVAKLIAGHGVDVGGECVCLCNHLLAEALDLEPVRGAAPGSRPDADGPAVLQEVGGLADDQLLSDTVRIHASHEQVDRAVSCHIQTLRPRGMRWARIGGASGMTRHSAGERCSGKE